MGTPEYQLILYRAVPNTNTRWEPLVKEKFTSGTNAALLIADVEDLLRRDRAAVDTAEVRRWLGLPEDATDRDVSRAMIQRAMDRFAGAIKELGEE